MQGTLPTDQLQQKCGETQHGQTAIPHFGAVVPSPFPLFLGIELHFGGQFSRGNLTRDHVLPISRGGDDKWENVVAACKRCNWLKDCQTPEEARMPLLAVPFRPNTYEWHYLAKERVLADQMEYLSQQFKAERDWAH